MAKQGTVKKQVNVANASKKEQQVASIMPYNDAGIRQIGDMYYEQNAPSKNMILYNKTSDINPNGCILGMPGAGMSFYAIREMINVILNTEDEIYILDPKHEYKPIAETLGGSVIKITNRRYIQNLKHLNNKERGKMKWQRKKK